MTAAATRTLKSGLVVVDRAEPMSWGSAEIVDWPRKPKKNQPCEPHVLVRRKPTEVCGPGDQRVFCEPGPREISLFTGAGGMDIGIEKAGFTTVVQHEWDESACQTLIHNRPNFFRHSALIQGDLRLTTTSMILREGNLRVGDAELLVGGPPCQGFSTAGKRRAGDERNDLVFEYLRVVREAQPHFFTMENVPGFTDFNGGKYMAAFLQAAHACYYELVYGLINAVEYGVPQDRTRFICAGTRRDLWEIEGKLASLPKPENFTERDLAKMKLHRSAPLFTAEDHEVLTSAPGIRYFPDREVLTPPRPCRNMAGDSVDIDPETGEVNAGRTATFLKFYKRLRREEPDRLVFSPAGSEAA